MDKGLRKEDFITSNEEIPRFAGLDEPGDLGYTWDVCSGYDLKSDYIVPRYERSREHLYEWRPYDPLLDTPDLFLKFARMYDQGLSVELILEWVHEYGCLGLGPAWGAEIQGEIIQNPIDRPAFYQALSALMDVKPSLMDDSDPVEGFWDEAVLAAAVLKLYEAVLFGNEEEAKNLVLFEFPFITLMRRVEGAWEKVTQDHFGESLTRELREAMLAGVREAKDFTTRERELTTSFVLHVNKKLYVRDFLLQASDYSIGIAGRRVRALCYPTVVSAVPGGDFTLTDLRSGWGFHNLLGAMYLQMHWVMTSGRDVVRCQHCGRIISLAKAPVPGARKPPRHKRFCNKYCRYNHYYQTKKKPAREGENRA